MEEVAWIQFTHFDRGVLAFVPYCLGTQMRSRFQSHKKKGNLREKKERELYRCLLRFNGLSFHYNEYNYLWFSYFVAYMIIVLGIVNDYFLSPLHLSVSFPFFLFYLFMKYDFH